MTSELGKPVLGDLLGIHAQTSLHAGAGTALGTVDLPIQRERHTQWPMVAGSAIKGILRDACRERLADRDAEDGRKYWFDGRADAVELRAEISKKEPRDRADADMALNRLFGPPTDGANEFAGALSVTDARILAFPVRSLKGVFAWVTCAAVLDRLERDAALADQLAPPQVPGAVDLGTGQFLSAAGCPCLLSGNQLVLEEFDFASGGDTTGVAELASWIAENLLSQDAAFKATCNRFKRALVVLNDDDFTHFVRHSTEVTARIRLNYETKTVQKGALFYQEFLPTDTVLYSVLLANVARAKGGRQANGSLLKPLTDTLTNVPYLQIGGDETTGKGLCALRMSSH